MKKNSRNGELYDERQTIRYERSARIEGLYLNKKIFAFLMKKIN